MYRLSNTNYYVRIDSPGNTVPIRKYKIILDQQQVYLHSLITEGEGDAVQSYEYALNLIQIGFQAGAFSISASDLQDVFASIKHQTTFHSRDTWLYSREFGYWIFWSPDASREDLQIRGHGSISKLLP